MRRTRLLAPLFALALALPLTLPLAGCGDDDDVTAPATATVETTTFAPSLGVDLTASGWTRTPSGLYYRILANPTGPAATVAKGQSLVVRYTGWLANGALFAPTANIPFVLGNGDVIAGWDQGIVGMRVGERRRLLIPPALGYGARDYNGIPGNSVLVFDVEVLSAT